MYPREVQDNTQKWMHQLSAFVYTLYMHRKYANNYTAIAGEELKLSIGVLLSTCRTPEDHNKSLLARLFLWLFLAWLAGHPLF
jgi:hypothetical protein